ncbi:MAG: MotA/TolQ/ExbB proton channel family protein [Candidatus Hydrothermales bacterium]
MTELNLDIVIKGFKTASPFAKLILIILFSLSVLSWAIFFKKFIEFFILKWKTKRIIRKFNDLSFEDLIEKNPIYSDKGILPSLILKTTKEEIKNLKDERIKEHSITILFEKIEKIFKKEITKLEKYNIILATVTSVSPFLGLLGTVWGIMEAFLEIKRTGSAHISVLAPGIADALITTIAGLLVAIPSLVFYNYITNEIIRYENLCGDFLSELKIKVKKYLLLNEKELHL